MKHTTMLYIITCSLTLSSTALSMFTQRLILKNTSQPFHRKLTHTPTQAALEKIILSNGILLSSINEQNEAIKAYIKYNNRDEKSARYAENLKYKIDTLERLLRY